MKTAVSIPDEIFAAGEKLAMSRGWTRSKLYAQALQEFLEKEQADPVTQKLDALIDEFGANDVQRVNVGGDLIDRGLWQW